MNSGNHKNEFSALTNDSEKLDMKFDYQSLIELIEHQLTECAWGRNAKHNPVRAELIKQLIKMEFNPIIVQRIAESLISKKLDLKGAWAHALSLVASQIPIYKEDVTAAGGIVALLGATGVGKTSLIAKMAARFALRETRNAVAIITTDGEKFAANEQLRVFGKILGIPVKVARNARELLDALNDFSDRSFVLIDTAGMGPKEFMKSNYAELFSGAITQIKNFLVLSSTTQRTSLEVGIQAFKDVKLDGCIISKVDETTSLGGALSAAIIGRLPIAYYSDGQKIPDDFHLARANNLAAKAITLADCYFNNGDSTSEVSKQDGLVSNVSI